METLIHQNLQPSTYVQFQCINEVMDSANPMLFMPMSCILTASILLVEELGKLLHCISQTSLQLRFRNNDNPPIGLNTMRFERWILKEKPLSCNVQLLKTASQVTDTGSCLNPVCHYPGFSSQYVKKQRPKWRHLDLDFQFGNHSSQYPFSSFLDGERPLKQSIWVSSFQQSYSGGLIGSILIIFEDIAGGQAWQAFFEPLQ